MPRKECHSIKRRDLFCLDFPQFLSLPHQARVCFRFPDPTRPFHAADGEGLRSSDCKSFKGLGFKLQIEECKCVWLHTGWKLLAGAKVGPYLAKTSRLSAHSRLHSSSRGWKMFEDGLCLPADVVQRIQQGCGKTGSEFGFFLEIGPRMGFLRSKWMALLIS